MLSVLGWQAWVTLGITTVLIAALVRDAARPDLVFLGGVAALLAFGILSPQEAFAGFSNSALIAVGSLLVVAAGVQSTGGLGFIDRVLFSRTDRRSLLLGRMMLTTASLSALLNNTPIVAMLIPRVKSWAERVDIPASKLMIPLSYAAIFGGMTTLIGTSTNLLVSGMMEAEGYGRLEFFDLTLVGVPAALCGILYFSTLGHRLLPTRDTEETSFERELQACLFELRVASSAPLVGRTIEEAGLRSLGNAYLAHLQRDGQVIPSSPEVVLHEGDRLTFQGSTAMLGDLLQRPGLERVVKVRAEDYVTLPLFEAVVAPSSELVGKTLREVDFRERYQGIVLGIHRRDEQIEEPLGSVPIKAGDLLLIEAQEGFDDRWNASREEFYLVAARRSEQQEVKEEKAPLALLILFSVIALAVMGAAPIAVTAFIGALAMLAAGCLSLQEARKAVDVPVLLTIAGALGLGSAVQKTGLAEVVAAGLIDVASGLGVVAVISAVYVLTNLFTEMITNNGAAALMVAIGLSAAGDLGVPAEAFAVAVAIAASASFMTPVGYQTNLMVMSPGGYRFSDYLRSGAAVNLLVAVVAITMIWLVWL